MRVSVVIPVRNRRALLGETLGSALLRIGPEDEILVVDDGSTDGSAEMPPTDDPRIRVVRTEGVGASAARNRGIAEAGGSYVAFLDSDDLWRPVGLDEQVAALEEDPDAGLCHARAEPIGEDGRPLDRPPKPPLAGQAAATLLKRNPVTTSTVVVPMRVLEEVGGFDEELARSMDRDLWLRIAERHPFAWLDLLVARYRFHPAQQIRSRRAVEEARVRIHEKTIERYGDDRPRLARRARGLLAYRLLRLGRICLSEGDREAAERHFAAAVRLRPLARLRARRYRRGARRRGG